MYALNLGADGRCLSATTIDYAPSGAVFAAHLPDGNLYEYRYVYGQYIHDPLPKTAPAETVAVPMDKLAVLQDKAAAYDVLTEGVNPE